MVFRSAIDFYMMIFLSAMFIKCSDNSSNKYSMLLNSVFLSFFLFLFFWSLMFGITVFYARLIKVFCIIVILWLECWGLQKIPTCTFSHLQRLECSFWNRLIIHFVLAFFLFLSFLFLFLSIFLSFSLLSLSLYLSFSLCVQKCFGIWILFLVLCLLWGSSDPAGEMGARDTRMT